MPQVTILQLCALDLSKLEEAQKISPVGSVTGRDGRVFHIDGEAVLQQLEADGLQIPLTVGHDYQGRAAGWFEAFELKGRGTPAGGIYARLRLNGLGQSLLEAEEYKYLSPEYLADSHTHEVERIVGVGLVNQPNLLKDALNQIEEPTMNEEEAKNLQTQNTSLQQEIETLQTQNNALQQQIKTHQVEQAIDSGKLAPSKREFALGLEDNALSEYLTLEAQTFQKTQPNGLLEATQEATDQAGSPAHCPVLSQLNLNDEG